MPGPLRDTLPSSADGIAVQEHELESGFGLHPMIGVWRNGTCASWSDALPIRPKDNPPLPVQHPNVLPAVVPVCAPITLEFEPLGDGFALLLGQGAHSSK